MTSSWCRWTQPDTITSRNDSSGGTEPMPAFYRDPSFEFMDSTGVNLWVSSPQSDHQPYRRQPSL
jgi:hypothetical protein